MEKTKYFCLDVSGSMSEQQLQMAFEQVATRARKTGDFLVAFDHEPYGILPVEEVLGKLVMDAQDLVRTLCPAMKGRGGTDARPVLQAVSDHARDHHVLAHIVLISDGELPNDDLKRFDEFVRIG